MQAMKYSIVTLALMLLFTSLSLAQPKASDDRCQGLNERVAALVNEYRELRHKRRELQQGTRDKDLDDDRGRLHAVLSSLGVELGRRPFTKGNIVVCLGESDAVRRGGQMRQYLEIYNRVLRKAGRKVKERGNREYLIYFWRGWHDFLFFISEGGAIVDHGWWFAYE